MNDNIQDNSFEELLSAVLEDYVHELPRPGLDRRILANLPAGRLPLRGILWAALATASVLSLATISLHLLYRPPTPPTTTASVPHDHGATSAASGDVIAGTLPLSPSHGKSRTPVAAILSTEMTATTTAPPALESYPSLLQVLTDSTEAEDSEQTPEPTTDANGEVKINPIHIAPIDISPLPSEEAAAQPILPIRIEPIYIAPIEISKLKTGPTNSNQ